MTASKLIVSVRCLSIDKIARFVSLAWLMVDRKYVFITFSFEKLLSQLAIRTLLKIYVVLWLGSYFVFMRVFQSPDSAGAPDTIWRLPPSDSVHMVL